MAKISAKKLKRFDLDEPKLPAAIEKAALGSGGYPYKERLERKLYEEELGRLQSQLLKLQSHVLVRRPQCPACGDPDAYRVARPLELNPVKKRHTGDGGK